MKRFIYVGSALLALVIMIGSQPKVARATGGSNTVTVCMMSPNGYFPGLLVERDMDEAHALADYLNGISSEETSWLLNFFAGLFGVDPPDTTPEFQICTQYEFQAPNGCFCTESLPAPPSGESGSIQYCFVQQGASELGTVVTQPADRARISIELFNSMNLEDTSALTDFFAWLMGTQPAQSLEFVPRACEAFSDAGGGQCRCDGHNTSGPFDPSDEDPFEDEEISSGEGTQQAPPPEDNPGDTSGDDKEHKVTQRRH